MKIHREIKKGSEPGFPRSFPGLINCAVRQRLAVLTGAFGNSRTADAIGNAIGAAVGPTGDNNASTMQRIHLADVQIGNGFFVKS
jgi:hypothetical protein